jgi:hypothetical protein
VDLRFVLGHIKDAVTYSHVYIDSTFEGIVEMRHGNSDGARIWLNGKEIFSLDMKRNVHPDQNITFAKMEEGINRLLIKQVVYQDDNSFYMRFTAPGNATLEGLQYYDRMPPLDPPRSLSAGSDWVPGPDVVVSWESPENDSALDHYEWSIDGSETSSSYGTSTVLTDLIEGDHDFCIWGIDQMGFPGIETSLTIRVDPRMPLISVPTPDTSISLVAFIHWDWELLVEPRSGIDEYLVTIENWKHGTSEVHFSVKDLSISETEFLLSENIKDGYHYRISVKAVSGSGVVRSVSSEVDVLVDLTEPLRPYGFNMEQVEAGSRRYWLTWMDSIDNTNSGIDNYEVWWSLDWSDWTLYEVTEGRNISITRPLGRSMAVKVRAKDISSHFSDFTRPLFTENQPPEPQILVEGLVKEGAPILISTQEIVDIDGEIISYRWMVNGNEISRSKRFTITFPYGYHIIDLEVIDDQGIKGRSSLELKVGSTQDNTVNGSLTKWLEDTSEMDREMPEITNEHWNNETIYLTGNKTGDMWNDLKDRLMDALVLVIGIPWVIILVLSLLFLSLRDLSPHVRVPPREAIMEEMGSKDKEKQRILNDFMKDQVVKKALEFDGRTQLLRTEQEKLTPSRKHKQTSSPFKAAPGLELLIGNTRSADEVIWDEDVLDDFEEWEEVDD